MVAKQADLTKTLPAVGAAAAAGAGTTLGTELVKKLLALRKTKLEERDPLHPGKRQGEGLGAGTGVPSWGTAGGINPNINPQAMTGPQMQFGKVSSAYQMGYKTAMDKEALLPALALGLAVPWALGKFGPDVWNALKRGWNAPAAPQTFPGLPKPRPWFSPPGASPTPALNQGQGMPKTSALMPPLAPTPGRLALQNAKKNVPGADKSLPPPVKVAEMDKDATPGLLAGLLTRGLMAGAKYLPKLLGGAGATGGAGAGASLAARGLAARPLLASPLGRAAGGVRAADRFMQARPLMSYAVIGGGFGAIPNPGEEGSRLGNMATGALTSMGLGAGWRGASPHVSGWWNKYKALRPGSGMVPLVGGAGV